MWIAGKAKVEMMTTHHETAIGGRQPSWAAILFRLADASSGKVTRSVTLGLLADKFDEPE